MHDVVLDHLKVGDEVVWLPDGKPVSLHTLDIGRVSRTLYHVNEYNQETLLAIVDFHDWVEGSQEVRDFGGGRSFRLRVFAKHLKRLGEFLESVNSNGSHHQSFQDVNNNGRRVKGPIINGISYGPTLAPPTPTVGRVPRSYVVRPCVLSSKRPSSHPLISELDQIYVYFNNAVLHGVVKRLFVGDGNNLFIGAEFNGVPVYPQQLAHSPCCPYKSNGCESRIGIQISNLTKHIWESEFRLIVNGTKQITFEDLFYKEDSPPSYSAVTSSKPFLMPMPMSMPPLEINHNSSHPASAPPLTPSPPPPMTPQPYHSPQWEQFNQVSPPFMEKLSPEIGKQPSSSGFQPLSRNYSASMMNLDSVGVGVTTVNQSQQKPVLSQRPSAPPNRKSLLVDELKRKLKIEPKSQLESSNPFQNGNQPQHQFDPVSRTDTTPEIIPQPRRISQTSEPNFLNELKRRQQSRTGRPISMEPTNPSVVPENKLVINPQRQSLPSKPTPDNNNTAQKNGLKRSDFALPFPLTTTNKTTNLTAGGMTRATSCINISETKPPTTPKPRPTLAPKPLRTTTPKPTIKENQFVFGKPESNLKIPIISNSLKVPPLPPRPTKPEQKPESNQDQTQQSKIPTPQIPAEPPQPPLPSRSLPQYSKPLEKTFQKPEIIQPPPPSKLSHFSPSKDLASTVTEIAPQKKLPTSDPDYDPLPPRKSKLYPDLPSEPILTPLNTDYERTVSPPQSELYPPHPPALSNFSDNPNSENHPEPEDDVPFPPQPLYNEHQPESQRIRNIISRDNLPPPPPPPPPPPVLSSENNLQPFLEEEDANFPPPPPETDPEAERYDSDKNEAYQNVVNAHISPVIIRIPDKNTTGRGTFLQQIHDGVKLRPAAIADNEADPKHEQPSSSSTGGFANIIKGAIATRRVMLDSDEESNPSEYDEDSDAWD